MSIFEGVFGGRDAFYQIDAIKAIYAFCVVLTICIFFYGFLKVAFACKEDLSKGMLKFGGILLCCYLAAEAPKYMESYKNVAATVQQENGFNPDQISRSFERLLDRATEDYADQESENSTWFSWTNISKKAGDILAVLFGSVAIGILAALAYIIDFVLTMAMLLRDVAFYIAVCLVPLSFALIGSGLDTQRGIKFLFTGFGVASWPLAWLLVDALLFLVLKPLDPQIGSESFVQNSEVLASAPIVAGIMGLIILKFVALKLIVITVVGYGLSIKVCHDIFGSISTGVGSLMTYAMGRYMGVKSTAPAGAGSSKGAGAIGTMPKAENNASQANQSNSNAMVSSSATSSGASPREGRIAQENFDNRPAGQELKDLPKPGVPAASGNWRDDQAAMNGYQQELSEWQSGSSGAGTASAQEQADQSIRFLAQEGQKEGNFSDTDASNWWMGQNIRKAARLNNRALSEKDINEMIGKLSSNNIDEDGVRQMISSLPSKGAGSELI